MRRRAQTRTGSIIERLGKVEDNTSRANLELSGCVIAGSPGERNDTFFNATFVNCIFLHEGMEASCSEWLSLISMQRMPVRKADHGQSQVDQQPGAIIPEISARGRRHSPGVPAHKRG